MAVSGIKGNKRMGIEPPEEANCQVLSLGWINDEKQLCLTSKDANKISIKFSQLKVARNLKLKSRRSRSTEPEQFSFKPNIRKSSRSKDMLPFKLQNSPSAIKRSGIIPKETPRSSSKVNMIKATGYKTGSTRLSAKYQNVNSPIRKNYANSTSYKSTHFISGSKKPLTASYRKANTLAIIAKKTESPQKSAFKLSRTKSIGVL